MRLKLISLNLRGYVDWSDREKSIVSFLETEQADIVLLQEVFFDAAFSPYNQAEMLNRQLSTPYEYMQTAISKFYLPSSGNPYREGLAILSRFPMPHTEALALTKQMGDKHTRIILHADVTIGELTVPVVNVHFSNNQYSADQLRELFSIIQRRDILPVIAGDFNIFDLAAHGGVFRPGYAASTDLTPYVSYPSEGRTLDYVLSPATCPIIELRTAPGLSDHNALVCTLELDN